MTAFNLKNFSPRYRDGEGEGWRSSDYGGLSRWPGLAQACRQSLWPAEASRVCWNPEGKEPALRVLGRKCDTGIWLTILSQRKLTPLILDAKRGQQLKTQRPRDSLPREKPPS